MLPMGFNQLNSLGVGIAFGYYLYLKDAPFEHLNQRINDFESVHSKQCVTITERKVLILVPKLCPTALLTSNLSENRVGNMSDVEKDVAGVRGRAYPLTVYKITKADVKKHFILETAQCLDVIFKIYLGRKQLTEVQKKQVTEQFMQMLMYLLDSDVTYRNYYKIIPVTANDDVQTVILNGYNSVRPLVTSRPTSMTTKFLGIGLAYWYFYNYLCMTAPELQTSIENWQLREKCDLLSKKVFVLVPRSCNCPKEMVHLDDPFIEYAKDLDNNPQAVTIGTTHGRPYVKPVLILTDNDKKEKYYCIAEYATPIRQLYRMFDECYKKLGPVDEEDQDKHRHEFIMCLKQLLKTDFDIKQKIKYCDLYEVFPYLDNVDGFKLSVELLKKIRSSLNKKRSKK